MGIINRILLFVFSIAVAVLSLGVLAAGLQILPESVWLNEFRYALAQPETLAAAVVVFLLSLQLFFCSFRRQGPRETDKGEFLVLQNEKGNVRVALDAVRSLMEQSLLGVAGVRLARVRPSRIHGSKDAGDTLGLRLDLSIGRGFNVNDVSEAAREEVSRKLQDVLGLADVQLDIRVTALSDAALPSKRRVV